MTADYGFVKRRAWVIGHVIALVAIIAFVNLGFWQLRRHDERSALDAQLAARAAAASISIGEATDLPIDEVEFRRVEMSGCFDASAELILQARSLNGRSGHNVITPLIYDVGAAVLVNRGWIPIDVEGPPVAEATPPDCPTTVVGIVRDTEIRGSFGPTDPASGALERINRVDIERLAPQFDYELVDFYLQAIAPASDGLPLVNPAPEPGGGPPHLAYAGQWFAFAAVVAVGYPVLLRSTARKSTQD